MTFVGANIRQCFHRRYGPKRFPHWVNFPVLQSMLRTVAGSRWNSVSWGIAIPNRARRKSWCWSVSIQAWAIIVYTCSTFLRVYQLSRYLPMPQEGLTTTPSRNTPKCRWWWRLNRWMGTYRLRRGDHYCCVRPREWIPSSPNGHFTVIPHFDIGIEIHLSFEGHERFLDFLNDIGFSIAWTHKRITSSICY